ncbi:uncharacterized protein B0H18DRAFT_959787 [Fomitopsis serialis]|uniref:uncharacterized protein n=1 Tax=Fomitopsis serialis TaxID=139415 RepID=UPI002007EBA0|nr:uncharacterized protein B0H18DRAFT_959787 [Neoantrodia serialis]KAH9914463.1 hypothetical protein B0H18DRAFT_959787 [Neoantrodia serialis]
MASNDRNDTHSESAARMPKRYKHPFTENEDWAYYAGNDDDPTEKDTPRTLAELRMCALSAAIRQKPEWWVKFRDENVQTKWTEEIKEQQKDMHRSLQLTDNMIHYILGELDAYAALRDPETGIEPGPYERIWQSDQLIPASLKASLVSAVAPLESVPDSEKDWHPGSDGRVLDLVHPSLYPVVYGRTTTRGFEETLQPRATDVAAMFRSERFQWLPSDSTLRRMAQNHKALTEVIPKVMEKAVPMFEWILSDLARETQLPTRLDLKGYEPNMDRDTRLRFIAEHDRLQAEDRKVWEAGRDKLWDDEWDVFLATRSSEDEEWEEPPYPEFKEVNYLQRFFNEWQDAQAEHLWPDASRATMSTSRAIMNNVTTTACAIYTTYRDEICVQTVGQVTTKQDRCIAFPNIYQHLVSPFRLVDPTKPGHRKISSSSLSTRTSPSISDDVESTNLWWRLPFELQEMVWERLDLLTEEQAKQYREELMKERR